MPAHLALNTIWLWLYSRPDRRAFYLAPFVGVVAIGLHQPIVHALFVAPFLVRLVLQRRWRTVGIFTVIYLAGCLGWFMWKAHAKMGVEALFQWGYSTNTGDIYYDLDGSEGDEALMHPQDTSRRCGRREYGRTPRSAPAASAGRSGDRRARRRTGT